MVGRPFVGGAPVGPGFTTKVGADAAVSTTRETLFCQPVRPGSLTRSRPGRQAGLINAAVRPTTRGTPCGAFRCAVALMRSGSRSAVVPAALCRCAVVPQRYGSRSAVPLMHSARSGLAVSSAGVSPGLTLCV